MADIIEDPFHDLPECAAHDPLTDTDCEFCAATIKAKQARIERLSQVVNGMAQELQSMGMGVPPTLVDTIRLDVLLDSILADPNQRANYEITVGARVGEAMKGGLAQGREQQVKSRLSTPVPKSLIVPEKRSR